MRASANCAALRRRFTSPTAHGLLTCIDRDQTAFGLLHHLVDQALATFQFANGGSHLADRNRAKLKSEFHRATLATILATIGSIAVTLAAAPYLLMAYGNEYAAAIDLIWLLSIAFLARSVSGQAHELLMIMGYQRALTVINGAAIVLGAVMIIVLARMLHVEGAAIAVGIISALRSLALYVLARQALFSH